MKRSALVTLSIFAIAAVFVAGCTAKKDPATITGNPWVVTQVLTSEGLKPIAPGKLPVVNFGTDGRVAGNSTINLFSAPYTMDGSSVRMGPVVRTRWTGLQTELLQDQLVLSALGAMASFAVRDGVLELSNSSNQVVMTLSAAHEPDLVGQNWRCLSFTSESSGTIPVIETSAIGAGFSPIGGLAGTAGVNSYEASYTVSGSEMTITGVKWVSEMAGSEPLMAQEKQYVEAIARTASYKIQGFHLTLFDSSDATVAVFGPHDPKQ